MYFIGISTTLERSIPPPTHFPNRGVSEGIRERKYNCFSCRITFEVKKCFFNIKKQNRDVL